MTTNSSGSEDDAHESDFVRPSLTLRNRHDELLDDLHAARYGSRSEATRAAIESLAKSVLGDGETGVEQISSRVKKLQVQMNEVADQIDELQQELPAGTTARTSSPSSDDIGSKQGAPTVESTGTQGSAEIQHEIYALLSENGEMSVPEIAEQVDEDPFVIHENLEELVENRGFVTCAQDSDGPRFAIKNAASN